MQARHFLHPLRVPLWLFAACLFATGFVTDRVEARDVSVQEAVAKTQKETNGKVLSVQTLTIGKRKVYRIKILTPDGQVRVVQVPADQ